MQAGGHHHQVAGGNGEPVAKVQVPGDIFDPHQEPVLHRVHVDFGRQRAAVAGQHIAHVIAAGVGHVQALPAHQLRPPGHVGILAVDEEIGIEELAVERDVLDHRAAVERGRGSGAEDVLVLQEMAVVHLLAAAVQVAQHGVEVDSGGIHHGLLGDLEVRRHGQQLAAHRADGGIELAGIHQRLDEIGQQQHVGIQRQHPIAARKLDGLVLRGREPDVLFVVIDLAAVFELFEDIDRAIGGSVIDDDDFLERVLLRQHRFQAPFDEPAAVVGNYRDRDEVVMRHEPDFNPRRGLSRPLPRPSRTTRIGWRAAQSSYNPPGVSGSGRGLLHPPSEGKIPLRRPDSPPGKPLGGSA